MTDGLLGLQFSAREGFYGAMEAPRDVTSRPIIIGTSGDVVLEGEGIAPIHLVVAVSDGRVLAASGHRDTPAFTDEGPIPTEWIELTLPCHVLVGDLVITFFWLEPSAHRPPRPPLQRTLAESARAFAGHLLRWRPIRVM